MQFSSLVRSNFAQNISKLVPVLGLGDGSGWSWNGARSVVFNFNSAGVNVYFFMQVCNELEHFYEEML